MQLGEDIQISLVNKAGTTVLRSGPWATLILKSEFAVAVVGNTFKSELIRALRGLLAQQELSLRWGRNVDLTGNALFQRISSELANVEAVTTQVVGQVKTELNELWTKANSNQSNSGSFLVLKKTL